jgi:protein tyrosine phosphatase
VNADPTRIDLRLDPRKQRMEGIAIHGNTPFSVPYISHVDGNLWTGGCAEGLVLPAEIEHVVSLYPWESYKIQHQPKSLSFQWLYDSEDMADAGRLWGIARYGSWCVSDGPTLVHCQAGLNRSGLIGALILILRGRTSEEAIALLREKRSPAVLCNRAFENWLLELEAVTA